MIMRAGKGKGKCGGSKEIAVLRGGCCVLSKEKEVKGEKHLEMGGRKVGG